MFLRVAFTLLAAMVFTACSGSPELPEDAALIYHGYANGMKGTMPGGVGRIYVVDERTGRVEYVTYIKDDPETETQPSVHFSGLKTDRKFSVYFEDLTR